MDSIVFVCGVLGIFLSTIGVTAFAVREHHVEKRRTLSELAARDAKTLREFRVILWTCGTLISIMMYGLVIPNISAGWWLAIFYTVIIACELLLAVIPANETRAGKVHTWLAFTMGTGMLALGLSFVLLLDGVFAFVEAGLLVAMTVLCALAIKYWHNFLYFELPYIFLSHMTILIAAIAVQ